MRYIYSRPLPTPFLVALDRWWSSALGKKVINPSRPVEKIMTSAAGKFYKPQRFRHIHPPSCFKYSPYVILVRSKFLFSSTHLLRCLSFFPFSFLARKSLAAFSSFLDPRPRMKDNQYKGRFRLQKYQLCMRKIPRWCDFITGIWADVMGVTRL